MQLAGIHHLTAVTADIRSNHDFYTTTLGMRLVKKTVNQDDVSAYHLFYADGRGTPGTDLTFFDWPLTPERRGTRGIVRTALRVPPPSLDYWAARLSELGVRLGDVTERNARATLDFEDPEGQRLSLVADEKTGDAHPWDRSPVPPEHQIRGLGPITLSVPELGPTETILTQFMNMRPAGEYPAASSDRAPADRGDGGGEFAVHVFEMGDGGPAAELHVAVEPSLERTRLGAGGVHHVAFRVPTFDEYEQWNQRLAQWRVPSSGPVDRFYFRSLYFREPNGILFELATDGPGFATDEPLESLGESLALPPFLEPRRAQIEAGLKPL